MAKPKLHELLAVEGDLEGAFVKIQGETMSTFTKKQNLFMGSHKTLKMFDDTRSQENLVESHQEIVETVPDKLGYTSESVIRYLDAVLQKDATNQEAKADIIIDGKTIAKDLPATFLLGLESKLKKVRDYYLVIPTLSPGIKWVKDPTLGEGYYKAETPEQSMKSEKEIVSKILYEATKEHPAQIERWTEAKAVGIYSTEKTTSMLSPGEKSILIGRVDKLLQAVKKARQRANSTEVIKLTVGKELFAYINS